MFILDTNQVGDDFSRVYLLQKLSQGANIPPQLAKIDSLLILDTFTAWSPDWAFFCLFYMSILANLMDRFLVTVLTL